MALFNKAELSGVRIFEKATAAEKATETAEGKTFDIFLSHSYSDKDSIKAIKQTIEEMSFSVYVDWIHDGQLDRSKVTKESADLLRKRMKQCRTLFFVTSLTSPVSKWMPWELGYFDAFKQRVAILPIVETPAITNEYKGQEYLGLYPYVAKDKLKGSEKLTLWIHEESNTYITFKSWLEGNNPEKQ